VNAIYTAVLKIFESDANLKGVRGSLADGLGRLNKSPSNASARDIEKVLKSNIYKQLQVSLSPASAKALVQQVLDEIAKIEATTETAGPTTAAATPASQPVIDKQSNALVPLEEGLKRFNLYFEWPEVQKFRSQVTVIREQQAAGRAVPDLVREAQVQLEALERKLQDLLVRQAQDIAELQSGFEKVKSMGGPRIKRLDTLLGQITDAQQTQTLAPAEVERARKLVLELRKLIESSVVQMPVTPPAPAVPTAPAGMPITSISSIELPPVQMDDAITIEDMPAKSAVDPDEVALEVESLDVDGIDIDLDFPELELSAEQSQRVKEIDLAEEVRGIETLALEFAPVLEINPEAAAKLADLRSRNAAQELLAEPIQGLRAELDAWREAELERQRARLTEIAARLDTFESEGLETTEARVTVSVAGGILGANALASEELVKLEDLLRAAQRQLDESKQRRAEEDARLERTIARQTSLLEELRGGLNSFAPLGEASANFASMLNDLAAATEAKQPRDDLTRKLGEESARLQQELEAFEAAKRAEAEAKAETERAAEAAKRAEEEAKLEAAEVERIRLENERLEVERRERERLENERRALLAREGGLLRAMRLSIAALPDLAELAGEQAALEAQLGVAARQVEAGQPISDQIDGFKAGLEQLGLNARAVFHTKIDDLEVRARDLKAFEMIDDLKEFRSGLEHGEFPDLAFLEASLRAQREAKLAAQRRELAELEGAVREYTGSPQSIKLQTSIAQARGRHEAGVLTDLAPLWDMLDELRIFEDNAASAWRTRAEAVVSEVEQFREMGGETVRQLLRLSKVLTAEPGARLSPETRLKLERTLEDAERLLISARQEFEAASAVAAALRDTGKIDDLLGIFGADSVAMKQAVVEATTAPLEVIEPSTPVQNQDSSPSEPTGDSSATGPIGWVAEISRERGVAQAALVSASGELEAGHTDDPGKLAQALLEMDRYQRELADELRRKPARICTVEHPGGAMLVVFLAGPSETKHFITVKLDDLAVMSRIFANAQRDYDSLLAWSQS
jgi:chromosome segregation protein